ncbi:MULTISPECIES: cytochrome P450 [unclassified Streptomyces]|uniref:cytochrome P450 family protein n=1 Tax=unclassified Streptomyces TaxID=2593676 RepID=UPI001370A59E|nr:MULTISPECIES: cytochrome P450 [unclassified Streptomyces]NEA00106.1 cytochrome P450 [Streptomyces sp. SID10116]MYY79865.1 cytochrome P450 [Streptomyces sp. SID335]MYZ14964.1 cytochrome P450 [Streptomyces sp. SID337]NDZ87469.1 cytochrome P450 [Streptomyces sp. SID10115]NEB43364.1 cytochrome P450 [Streptomyces sp. SID339]
MDPSGGCPHADNARLLARGAVAPVVLPGEVEGVAVLGHDALRELLSHPDVAKNAVHFTALRSGGIPDGWPLKTFATVQGMTTADGADHRRLRSLVSRAFTARRVEELGPRIAELTSQLLDGLGEAAAGEGDGVVDLRTHFALPLPMGVICELLGVDAGHHDRLHHLSNQIVATDIGPEQSQAANREMMDVLAAIVAARTEDPRDDLTSAMIAAREKDGDRLSPLELIGTLMLMIIAGHETTLNLITNAVRALCTHRDQLDLVMSGRASWPDVVEETLRWDSPVSYFPFRYPTRDLPLAGTVIPKGTPVLAGYSAAGRDPKTHGPDADAFSLTRTAAARHLSLGHGAHYCLGAPLARLEATVALEQLFTRFPRLDLAVPDAELPRHASFVGNSVRRLPVHLNG